MKHLTTFFFCILTYASFGQTSGHYLTISYSNNGQIYDAIDQFYFFALSGYQPNNDVFNYEQSDLKFNFQYEYVTHKNLVLFGKVGYSDRKDSYTISSVRPAHGNKEQNYLNISLGAKYILEGDNLQFSAGIEIPYYKISTYKEKLFLTDPQNTFYQTQFIDGGTVYGLNTIYSAKFFFTKTFFLSADLDFGLLFFNLGGQSNTVIDYQNPIQYPTSPYTPYDDSYKKTTVSKPEFYFGIGAKL